MADIAPVLDLQRVSQASEVVAVPPDVQESIPTPPGETFTADSEGQVQAGDGDFEPEDEEVTVEGMVVDTSAEALTPDGGAELPEQDAESTPIEADKMDIDETAATPPPQPPDQPIEEALSADTADAAVHTSHQEDQTMEVEQVQSKEPLDSIPPQQTPEPVPVETSPTVDPQAAPLSAIPSFIPVTPQTQPIMISAPAEPLRSFSSFNFVSDAPVAVPVPAPATIDPIRTQFHPDYTLPSLKTLPVEFNRKSRPSKLQRKKEKELQKELKGDGDKKGKDKDKEKDKDDFVPLGAMRWGITARVNPVYKRLPKATKCLSTRDWTASH